MLYERLVHLALNACAHVQYRDSGDFRGRERGRERDAPSRTVCVLCVCVCVCVRARARAHACVYECGLVWYSVSANHNLRVCFVDLLRLMS